MTAPSPTIEDIQTRILSRISVDDNACWNWTGAHNSTGYGYWSEGLHKPSWRIHRLIWALVHNEDMPRSKSAKEVIDHICNNRSCLNPKHLQKITQQQNLRRYAGKDGTHIGYHVGNHTMTDEDIRLTYKKHPSGFISESKICRRCQNLHAQNHRLWRELRDVYLQSNSKVA